MSIVSGKWSNRRIVKNEDRRLVEKRVKLEKEKGNKIVSRPEIREEIGWGGTPYYVAVVEFAEHRKKGGSE